jgi:FG-GAP repeat
MGTFRRAVLPAAFALALVGYASAPGTRASDSSSTPNGRESGGRQSLSPQPRPGPLHPATRPTSDFNGDGFSDLAIGVPNEDVVGTVDAGGVNVVYGSETGLAVAGNQWWTQDSSGIGDSVEASDQFGFSESTGDFNGDGFDDLAVGVPLEDSPEDSGVVNIIYGSPTGLNSAGSQVWSQDSRGIGDVREPGDQFGRALTAADFNHDGAADLAIGVPFERVNKRGHAGAVNVLYGSPTGLTSDGNQFWKQDSPGIISASEKGDTFGSALTVGDFDGDSFGDLVVGVPREDQVGLDSGVVNVIYGSASGLSAAGTQLWGQDRPRIEGSSETNDLLGFALVAADFDHDAFDDLALGVPFEDIGAKANAGAVNVIYGSDSGLNFRGNQLWSQDSSGIVNTADARDEFGFALAAGDLNEDLSADLAVGVPGEDPPTNAGAVAIINGRPEGLGSAGNRLWTQEGFGGSPNELWDTFAFSLVSGQYGKGNAADLAVGVPAEDVLTKRDAGAINVAYGSPQGLGPEGSQYWTQDDLAGPADRGDRFGYGLGGHIPA